MWWVTAINPWIHANFISFTFDIACIQTSRGLISTCLRNLVTSLVEPSLSICSCSIYNSNLIGNSSDDDDVSFYYISEILGRLFVSFMERRSSVWNYERASQIHKKSKQNVEESSKAKKKASKKGSWFQNVQLLVDNIVQVSDFVQHIQLICSSREYWDSGKQNFKLEHEPEIVEQIFSFNLN